MTRQNRKWDHISLAITSQENVKASAFNDLRFVHSPFPDLDVKDVSLATTVGGHVWNVPVYINAMTGGANGTERINESLAMVANEYGLAMAVGSQRSAIDEPSLQATYKIVRQTIKNGYVIANIGADATYDQAMKVIEMIDADYLQLHVNPVQELIMPEGDRSFRGILTMIDAIVQQVSIPVIVKEVGFGMSQHTYRQLLDHGVSLIDVGGRGGTNFAFIENERRSLNDYAFFQDYGQTTPESLLEAQPFFDKAEFLASGGIQTPLDIIKALALGAKAVGVAGAFLKTLQQDGVETLSQQVGSWIGACQSIMTILSRTTVPALQTVPMVIGGSTAAYCEARGIDWRIFAKRSS